MNMWYNTNDRSHRISSFLDIYINHTALRSHSSAHGKSSMMCISILPSPNLIESRNFHRTKSRLFRLCSQPMRSSTIPLITLRMNLYLLFRVQRTAVALISANWSLKMPLFRQNSIMRCSESQHVFNFLLDYRSLREKLCNHQNFLSRTLECWKRFL